MGLACLLMLAVFFVVPVEPDTSGLRFALRSAGTAGAVLIVGWIAAGQVRRQAAAGDAPTADPNALVRLASALFAGILVAALGDYVIQVSDPTQFGGLRTRVDALYFTLATLTTVGYGDVHAQGQVARVAVCLQMLFSVGIIATGFSQLIGRLVSRPPPGPGR
jgi:hypothetical protein